MSKYTGILQSWKEELKGTAEDKTVPAAEGRREKAVEQREELARNPQGEETSKRTWWSKTKGSQSRQI